jgi:hypothetical protein
MNLLILKIFLAILMVHTLIKFAFFFVLPYERRRKMLDASYGNETSATRKSDYFLLLIALFPVVLFFFSGLTEYLGFAVGLYAGMTLIQLYFHRFHEPLTKDKAPNEPISPIKMMSYAIQENPSRPWLELLIITVFVIWILFQLATKGFGLF